MRIVAGKFGGRKLISPKGKDVRPTSDKIRGAVFNMLQARHAVEGAYVLDAFCGSGALGLEALSRGAAFCRFMDKDKLSIDLVHENAQNFDCLEYCDFLKCDATKMRGSGETYSLVFLDPPYNHNLVSLMIETLVGGSFLCDGALMVCETERQCVVDAPECIQVHEKVYGSVKITLLQYFS